MKSESSRFPAVLGLVLASTLVSPVGAADPPETLPIAPHISIARLPSRAVLVEIFESIPDKNSWDMRLSEATETYTEPAFGFVVAPTKYSHKAIRVDRSVPFLFRASARVPLAKGEHRLLLRSRNGARLWMDGRILASTPFPNLNADGHEEVPENPPPIAPGVRYLRPGQAEALAKITSSGDSHVIVVEAVIGNKGRRPELGDLAVAISSDDDSFHILSPTLDQTLAYSEEGWAAYEQERRAFHKEQDAQHRQQTDSTETQYWAMRHERARKYLAAQKRPVPPNISAGTPALNDIDRFIGARLESAKVRPAPLTDDYAFIRRLALDTIGKLPTTEMIDGFLRDSSRDRRSRAIDRLLNDPGWADHWVSYWQDVLAENPGILKPMLNNTGPFRWWIYESLSDNKPMDRFVTELVMMEGSLYYGGTAGFSMATQNDVPMAQKAQIVAQAFLGMQMQCARCHDAPYHDFKQKDLFNLAAMLKREGQPVPKTSSIPENSNIVLGRLVNVTLKPGSKVEPEWPFSNVVKDEIAADVLRDPSDSREKLAALITDPRNDRFAKVLVNRVWKQYFGWGIVEPVDDWENAKSSHPELLDFLAREFLEHDYDLKHLARLILNSHAYQRVATAEGSLEAKPEARLFASPARRRMTAEQMVDSLFAVAGKTFNAEEMNLDVDCRRPVKDFNNLGLPTRAWEFTSLSNERDRPALAMPMAQQVADTLTTFGWRESRQSPMSDRDHTPNVVQSATVLNGLLSNGRIARLSDDSVFTALSLEERPLPELVRVVFLRILSRPPTSAEQEKFVAYLKSGYDQRSNANGGRVAATMAKPKRPVSWSNHLNPEATRIKQESEREAREGDPATPRLKAEWRERMEDVIWALINSPEFLFVP